MLVAIPVSQRNHQGHAMCGTGRAKLPPCFTLPLSCHSRQMQGFAKTPEKEGFYEVERFFCWQSRKSLVFTHDFTRSEPCTSKYCAMLEKIPLRLSKWVAPSFRRNFRGTTNKRSSLETLKKTHRLRYQKKKKTFFLLQNQSGRF